MADKIHSRARGPVQILTRQPMEGRARGGGLRFGEMERDAIIAHGTSHVLRDRLFEQSDKLDCMVCRKCGIFARTVGEDGGYCKACQSHNVAKVGIPYAKPLGLCAGIVVGVFIVRKVGFGSKPKPENHLAIIIGLPDGSGSMHMLYF